MGCIISINEVNGDGKTDSKIVKLNKNEEFPTNIPEDSICSNRLCRGYSPQIKGGDDSTADGIITIDSSNDKPLCTINCRANFTLDYLNKSIKCIVKKEGKRTHINLKICAGNIGGIDSELEDKLQLLINNTKLSTRLGEMHLHYTASKSLREKLTSRIVFIA